MTEPASHGKYRVLIVDDDEDARILLLRALRLTPMHFEVESAADGQQALDVVEAFRPHVVITDIMMPRLDGFELCIALRSNPATAAIPIIILTALEQEKEKRRGFAAGANAYLTKPLSAIELTAILRRLLD